MAYHMWYLATSDERVPFHEYEELIEAVGEEYSLTLIEGTDAEWVEFALAHKKDDHPIGNLKWIPVRQGVANDPGVDEITLFLDEIEEGCQPTCNVQWIRQFLPQVKTVYVWSLYSGTDIDNGWAPIHEFQEAFMDGEETAIYAELEGWSNTDGDHITWEFAENVCGGDLWWFGLHLNSRWHRFQMDLADRERREYFKRGEIPPGVKVLVDQDYEPKSAYM